MNISSTDALIILDVQNDFCPGGTMPVLNGELVAARLTLVAKKFIQKVQLKKQPDFIVVGIQGEITSEKMAIADLFDGNATMIV